MVMRTRLCSQRIARDIRGGREEKGVGVGSRLMLRSSLLVVSPTGVDVHQYVHRDIDGQVFQAVVSKRPLYGKTERLDQFAWATSQVVQLRGEGLGTGTLGAVPTRAVDGIGGRWTVESASGQGTTLHLIRSET